MKAEIQWLKLKKICEGLTDKTVHIQASTDVTMSARSGVVAKENDINIIINLNLIKRVDDVIDALAHELSHVILCTNNDSLIGATWLRIRDKLNKLYKGE